MLCSGGKTVAAPYTGFRTIVTCVHPLKLERPCLNNQTRCIVKAASWLRCNRCEEIALARHRFRPVQRRVCLIGQDGNVSHDYRDNNKFQLGALTTSALSQVQRLHATRKPPQLATLNLGLHTQCTYSLHHTSIENPTLFLTCQ